MERTFKKEFGSLEDVFSFLSEGLGALGVDLTSAFAINLAVEELFTNMVKYSTGSRNDVAIAVEESDGKVTVALTDTDVEPFDVTQVPAPDLSLRPADRNPGGLGIHLTRALVDSVDYRYENRTSVIIVTKTFQGPHVHDQH